MQNTPYIQRIRTHPNETFFDFSIPVFERQFSEEEFATQLLGEDNTPSGGRHKPLGFVQMGLSTRRINEKLHEVILYGVIPMALGILIGGICITFVLNRNIVTPLRRLAGITLEVAKGDIGRTVDIRSKDEIGQLSMNFNHMTRSLQNLYEDLKQEIAGHKHTEGLLKHRLQMEGLVAAISTNFLNSAPEKIGNEIHHALETIGKFANADRSYVFCFAVDAEKQVVNNTHEWCAEGIRPEIGNLQGIAVERLPWSMERLERFETIHVPCVADLPPNAHAEKELLQAQAIQSLVIVPMVYRGVLVGFLGFDAVRTEKIWDDNDILLLKLVGEIFVNALEHSKQSILLKESHEKLEIRVNERTTELLQAKDYAENLIETANVMIIGLDAGGNIQVFNETAEKITGYEKSEVMGKDCFKTLMPQNLSPDAWQVFHAWRATGQVQKSYENPILTKAGKRRFVSWQVSEVQEQGKPAGIISFGNDITEQKQMTALVERLRLMSFIGDVSVALSEGAALNDILRSCAEAIVRNLDAALARIWLLNEKDNVLELRAGAGISGRTDGDYSRVPVGKFMVGLIAHERLPYLSNSLESEPHVNELRWVRENGITAFQGHPLIFGGRLVGVVVMFSRKPMDDFTVKALSYAADIIALGIDRKQAEESLRASESKYRTLLENLPQRIFYKDRHSVYVSCNQNYARDLNIAPDEIIGKTDYDFYPKELAEKYRADDRRVLETKQVEDAEDKYIMHGHEMFIHTVKTPVKNAEGDVIGILGVFWDITEKIALQMESVRTRNLASLGELAAGVAHEINNPINGIINCAQILIDQSGDGSEENDLAGRIIKEGNRIANIVSSLLSFARSSDGKERMYGVHLGELLAETLTLVSSQFRKESIILKTNVPQYLPVIIACPQQLQQVFLNLISNARYALCQKYPDSHTDKILEIVAEEGVVDGRACVRAVFYDHGMGIPANIMDKVKDPFFTSKPRGKGTGLGLSISHGIISDHGGKLIIESIEGEFTRVEVVLPAISAAQASHL